MADRHPAPLRLPARALHIILPPPLFAFSRHRSLSLYFPPLWHSPVLSFHFGINPFHPPSSFCYSLTTFFFFSTLLVLFLSDFFIPALWAITPHGNCTGHVILALHEILDSTFGWPWWQKDSLRTSTKCKSEGGRKHFSDRLGVSVCEISWCEAFPIMHVVD